MLYNVIIFNNRSCSDGGLYYLTNTELRFCYNMCENISTCGQITIPPDHLKV